MAKNLSGATARPAGSGGRRSGRSGGRTVQHPVEDLGDGLSMQRPSVPDPLTGDAPNFFLKPRPGGPEFEDRDDLPDSVPESGLVSLDDLVNPYRYGLGMAAAKAMTKDLLNPFEAAGWKKAVNNNSLAEAVAADFYRKTKRTDFEADSVLTASGRAKYQNYSVVDGDPVVGASITLHATKGGIRVGVTPVYHYNRIVNQSRDASGRTRRITESYDGGRYRPILGREKLAGYRYTMVDPVSKREVVYDSKRVLTPAEAVKRYQESSKNSYDSDQVPWNLED